MIVETRTYVSTHPRMRICARRGPTSNVNRK